MPQVYVFGSAADPTASGNTTTPTLPVASANALETEATYATEVLTAPKAEAAVEAALAGGRKMVAVSTQLLAAVRSLPSMSSE